MLNIAKYTTENYSDKKGAWDILEKELPKMLPKGWEKALFTLLNSGRWVVDYTYDYENK